MWFLLFFSRCCKMHDWCYTTTSCMGLDWDLPYFVPFKWKCNGGSPYCSKFHNKQEWTRLNRFSGIKNWTWLRLIGSKVLHPKCYKHWLFNLFWPHKMHFKAKITSFLTFMLINFLVRTLQKIRFIVVFTWKKHPQK